MVNLWGVVGNTWSLAGLAVTRDKDAKAAHCDESLVTGSLVEEVESVDSTECPLSPLPSPQASAQWPMPQEYFPLQQKYAIVMDNTACPKVLGEGAHGVVYQGFSKDDGMEVAIKVVQYCDEEVRSSLAREVQVLRRVADHPGVLKLVDIIDSQDLAYSFLVTELCNGGDLFTCISEHGTLSEDKARRFFAQLLDAVEYIHRNGCAHLDLKLENICIDDKDMLKVIDFGLSSICSLRACVTRANLQEDEIDDLHTNGTFECLPPEALQGKCRGQDVDVWGLGVVLFEMLTGRNPFNNKRELILKGRYSDNCCAFRKLSYEAKQLFAKLFMIDPKQRPTIQQIRESAWMSESQSDALSKLEYSSVWDTIPQRYDVIECQCAVCSLVLWTRSPSSSLSWRDNFCLLRKCDR